MAKKNSRATRAKIVSAAWKLFYEQGYEDTTVEEIIEVSKSSALPAVEKSTTCTSPGAVSIVRSSLFSL